MSKKNVQSLTIRSSAAEYLTFVAAAGDAESSVEMRYEDENIWLTQKNDVHPVRCFGFCRQSALEADIPG